MGVLFLKKLHCIFQIWYVVTLWATSQEKGVCFSINQEIICVGSTAAYVTRTHMIYSHRNCASQITLRASSYIKATLIKNWDYRVMLKEKKWTILCNYQNLLIQMIILFYDHNKDLMWYWWLGMFSLSLNYISNVRIK